MDVCDVYLFMVTRNDQLYIGIPDVNGVEAIILGRKYKICE